MRENLISQDLVVSTMPIELSVFVEMSVEMSVFVKAQWSDYAPQPKLQTWIDDFIKA